jgi:hypothetical protein
MIDVQVDGAGLGADGVGVDGGAGAGGCEVGGGAVVDVPVVNAHNSEFAMSPGFTSVAKVRDTTRQKYVVEGCKSCGGVKL